MQRAQNSEETARGAADAGALGAASRMRLATLAYTFLVALAALGWLAYAVAPPSPAQIGICVAPALLGLVLGMRGAAELRTYLPKLLAVVAMGPILLLFWLLEQGPTRALPLPHWVFGVGAALAHGLGFVAFVVWAARATGAVERDPRAQRVSVERLTHRILSLTGLAEGWSCRRGPRADELVCEATLTPERRVRFELRICEAERLVWVREVSSASGPPEDEDEARMAPLGEHGDPSHPRADRVFARELSASTIDRARLARTPVEIEGERTRLRGGPEALPREDRLLYVLCAVVTRSGFDWRPTLFFPSDARDA